jgi:hypothetical protein
LGLRHAAAKPVLPEPLGELELQLDKGRLARRESQDSRAVPTFHPLAMSRDLLEDALGRRVELVTTESLSPYLGPHILAEAEDVVRAA